MGRTGNSMNTIYRSVPPRPYSYTFSDILRTSLEPRTPGHHGLSSRSKTAPVSSNAPEEYAERFKSRPTTRPAVIHMDCAGVRLYAGSGAVCRFNKPGFPAVKTSRTGPSALSMSKAPLSEALPPPPLTERGTAGTSSLHLAPLTRTANPNADPDPDPFCPIHPPRKGNNNNNNNNNNNTTNNNSSSSSNNNNNILNITTRTHTPEIVTSHPGLGRSSASSFRSRGKSPHYGADRTQGKSAGSSQPLTTTTPGTSDSQWQELSSSKLSTLDTLAFAASHPHALGEHSGYAQALAHSDNFDNLSELPKPKRILPRRDLPWVFRFKVKKELNALSKIMASKPAGANAMAAVGPMA